MSSHPLIPCEMNPASEKFVKAKKEYFLPAWLPLPHPAVRLVRFYPVDRNRCRERGLGEDPVPASPSPGLMPGNRMSRSSSTTSMPLTRAGAGLPKVDLPIALPHAPRRGAGAGPGVAAVPARAPGGLPAEAVERLPGTAAEQPLLQGRLQASHTNRYELQETTGRYV